MTCNCMPIAIEEVIDGTTLVLTFNNTPVFSNTRKFSFRICPNIVSVVTEPLPVVVNMNVDGTTAQVALLDKFGNTVYSNTLYRGAIYSGYMGSVPDNHVIIYNTPNCRS